MLQAFEPYSKRMSVKAYCLLSPPKASTLLLQRQHKTLSVCCRKFKDWSIFARASSRIHREADTQRVWCNEIAKWTALPRPQPPYGHAGEPREQAGEPREVTSLKQNYDCSENCWEDSSENSWRLAEDWEEYSGQKKRSDAAYSTPHDLMRHRSLIVKTSLLWRSA